MDQTKVSEYLTDMIAYFSRMEERTTEPEEEGKYRYCRYTLEAMLKQVDDGGFE